MSFNVNQQAFIFNTNDPILSPNNYVNPDQAVTASGGTGVVTYLDPLYFGGAGTEESPIFPYGYKGTDGLAYTYDGEDIILLLGNPAAPTGGEVDDDLGLFFGIIKNPDYPNVEDYEGFIGIGGELIEKEVEEAENGTLYIEAGNVDAAVGTVGVRVKAVVNIRNASSFLTNDEPFVAVTQDIDQFTAYDIGNFVGRVNIGGKFNNVRSQNSLYGTGRANYYFPSGVYGWIMIDLDGTEPSGDLEFGIASGRDSAPNPSAFLASMAYNWGNNRISTKDNEGDPLFDRDYTPSSLLKLRLRFNATRIDYEVSTDGGETWDNHGGFDHDNSGTAWYIKFLSQGQPAEAHNIVALGVVPVPVP